MLLWVIHPAVINCEPATNSISESIQKAFVMNCSDVVNPFGNGNSSQKIKDILKSVALDGQLLKKHFFDLR
jgi:UDP-N-acetylglucosamine 2-epimerase